jgi:hypothetical protein
MIAVKAEPLFDEFAPAAQKVLDTVEWSSTSFPLRRPSYETL